MFPKLIEDATAADLRTVLRHHLEENAEHIARLEKVFELMQMSVHRRRSQGMQHLIAAGTEMIAECVEDGTRDALIIAAAQKCVHYEIATYATLRGWAHILARTDVTSILERTLKERKAADLKLTIVSERLFNEEAGTTAQVH